MAHEDEREVKPPILGEGQYCSPRVLLEAYLEWQKDLTYRYIKHDHVNLPNSLACVKVDGRGRTVVEETS